MNLEKEVFELAIEDIMPNRFQPREKFDEHALNELALSIKEHGVIQPIIVRKIGDKYEIVAGERRYRASKIAGKRTVPALIRNIEDKESAKIALLENLQRKNLTAIEEARTYQTILKLDNLTQEELANNLGKSQSAVANKLRLLNLDMEVQNALLEEKISERHARSLLNLENKTQQKEFLDKVISNRMTVKQLDEEIGMMTGKKVEEIPEEPESESVPSGGIISNFVDSPEIINAMTDEIIPTTSVMPEMTSPAVEQQNQPIIAPKQPEVSVEQNVLTEQVIPTIPVTEQSTEINQVPIINKSIMEQPTQGLQPVAEEPATYSGVPNFFNTRLSKEKEETSMLPPIQEPIVEQPIIPTTPIAESVVEETTMTEPVSNEKELSAYESIEKLLNEKKSQEEEAKKENEEQDFLSSLNNIIESTQTVEPPKYSFEQPVVEVPTVEPVAEQQHTYSFEQPESVVQINNVQPEPQLEVPTTSLNETIIQTPIVEAKKDDIYDLRFAINNFRQAVQNTEKFGFNIETEEFDFNNIYQIVIKIDKNK